MAVNVYSYKLASGNDAFNNALITLYTPPLGYKAVVRDVEWWFNGWAAGQVFKVSALDHDGSVCTFIQTPTLSNPALSDQWQGRLVLEQLDSLILETAAGPGRWALWVSGYQLQLP